MRRGDPRFGQAAHAQQIRQIAGVTHVVLHPPIREGLDPQRMREMDPRATGLEHIHRPVVGVGPERGATLSGARFSGPHLRTKRVHSCTFGSPRARAVIGVRCPHRHALTMAVVSVLLGSGIE
jgi:hypothetical protein